MSDDDDDDDDYSYYDDDEDDDDNDDVIVAMMIKIMLEDDVSNCPLEETLRRRFRVKSEQRCFWEGKYGKAGTRKCLDNNSGKEANAVCGRLTRLFNSIGQFQLR